MNIQNKQHSKLNGLSQEQQYDQIDEDLHSRQLAVYGMDSMKKLSKASVLISGLNGVGVEVAKNVVLVGVKSVILQDTEEVSLDDLSSQFYLSESDVGKNRAEVSQSKLQDLNRSVNVVAKTSLLDAHMVQQNIQVVVLCGNDLEQSIAIDKACREHSPPIAVVRVESRGVFGSIFCDFGPKFIVGDVNGEEPKTGIISSIIQGKQTLLNCIDDERLEFEDGEFVQLSEIVGAEELNDIQPTKIKDCTSTSITLDLDSSNFKPYTKGGLVTQVKQPKVLEFKSLQESLVEHGEFLLSDWSKFERPALLHVAFQALDQFKVKNKNYLPQAHNPQEYKQFLQICEEINKVQKQDANLDEKVLMSFVDTCTGQINPIATLLGGIAGQEVVKACSNKFHPIQQYFYFDAMEALPEHVTAQDRMPQNSRYDSQVRVFGRQIQDKLQSLNVFLVGAGALGCEQLKNFAMMGIGSSSKGQVYITDDDNIEKSNLSRQFLFRDKDINKAKSDVAARAVMEINPLMKIKSFETRVQYESESTFNEKFWDSLDVVVNALDNVKARLYVDQRCVYFNKPLLESGTLGTKCNTQMVIPKLTENYGATNDPPEKSAPMCTLHSFPHNIDHCLTWARSEFIGLMEQGPGEVNTYLQHPSKLQQDALKQNTSTSMDAVNTILKVKEYLVEERPKSFEDCLTWARNKFQDMYYNKIMQLTYSFPEDTLTSTGNLFWSPPKRFPRPVVFDANEATHYNFVAIGAQLWAAIFSIQVPEKYNKKEQVKNFISKIQMQEFKPNDNVKIETDPKVSAPKSNTQSYDTNVMQQDIDNINKVTKGLDPQKDSLKQIVFEKDNDTQMEFVAALANLRAKNYSIQQIDKLKARFIAGRIIPAVATATAVATGLVMLELYKVIQNKPLESYRNTFVNLGLPLFAMSEPIAPKSTEFNAQKWSIWDRWILKGDRTVQELLDYLQNEKKLAAYSISYGASLLYNNVFPKHRERLNKKFSTLAKDVTKKDIPVEQSGLDLVVACENDDGDDVDIPLLTLVIK